MKALIGGLTCPECYATMDLVVDDTGMYYDHKYSLGEGQCKYHGKKFVPVTVELKERIEVGGEDTVQEEPDLDEPTRPFQPDCRDKHEAGNE